jgi:hypothetical protein
LDNNQLQKANTIILNGLNTYQNGLTELLIAKAKEGSSIAVFPGKNTNITELNKLLTQLNLTTISRVINEKFAVNKINYTDAFFKGVFTKKPSNSTFSTQSSYLKLVPSGHIISLLQLENNDPVFIRSSIYKTFLFAGSLAKENGNLTANAIFSTILLRVGEMSTSEKPIFLTIGGNARYPVLQEQLERPIRLKNDKFEFIPFKTVSNGRSLISVQQIPNKNIQAGQYKILDDKELGVLSLNYDRKESNLNYLDMSTFVQQLNEKGFTNVKANTLEKNASVLPINTSNKEEYWKLLLILALMFFLVEMALIKFWK